MNGLAGNNQRGWKPSKLRGFINQLAALITALHRCAQEQLPVALVAAGLPRLRALAQGVKLAYPGFVTQTSLRRPEPLHCAHSFKTRLFS
jgi:hypothetical protein